MSESLEHTIIHYKSLFKDHKPMEAYQLVTIGYHNTHESYGDKQIWINKKENKGVLMDLIKSDPITYTMFFQYNLNEKIELPREKPKWWMNPEN